MWQRMEQELEEELFLAGERVRPGIYRQVGGGREVLLQDEDFLPASLDGRVACYLRINNTWAEMAQEAVVQL